jgi:predicted Zn-dependent protease
LFPLTRFKTALVTAMALMLSCNASMAQALGGVTRNAGGLPSLGDNLELSAGAERRLGDRIAASIYRDPDYIDDPVLVDYMQGIWQSLMAAARARGELNTELDERFAWGLFLIRDRSINAFALPGGYMGVHLGLIAAVTSKDELAAVLGHELSHITQRHISRLITQQARTTPLLIAAMILGALATAKSPNAAQAAIVGGQAVAAQSQLNFSRDMEREADRVGFNVMTDAGFDSRGVVSMFEKLQQSSRINDNGSFPYLRSHPLSTQRIAEAQARLQLDLREAHPGKATASESAQARLLQALMAARASVLSDPGVDALRAMVAEAERQVAPGTDARSVGNLYAGALAAAKLRDFALARRLAERIKGQVTSNVLVANATSLLTIEIDLLAGVVPAGAAQIEIGKTTVRADLLMQARALLAAGKPQAVSDRLITWVTLHPKDDAAWQLLAVAYGNQNQSVRAIRADAEGRVAQLDYIGALERFRAAQTMIRSNPGSADFVEGSIIDTRARQLASLVKEQALQDKLDR